MRDLTARWMAVVALGAAVVGGGGYAAADSLSEPDAYALRQEVVALQEQVAELSEAQAGTAGDINDLYANDGVLDERTAQAACVAYSDFHYVRERVNNGRRRWRLPLAVWNMSDPGCRPNPKKAWRPSHRVYTPLNLEARSAR